MNEPDVIRLIQGISRLLSEKFVFGYHDKEDIEQQAFILGMECLPRYNPQYSLSTFLYHHINNRLKTFKRDNFIRPPAKCPYCDGIDYCEQCERRTWRTRKKKNLMEPIDLNNVRAEREHHMSISYDLNIDLDIKNIKQLIDTYLPVLLREDYLKMQGDILVPKPRREKVKEAILSIIKEHTDYEM